MVIASRIEEKWVQRLYRQFDNQLLIGWGVFFNYVSLDNLTSSCHFVSGILDFFGHGIQVIE